VIDINLLLRLIGSIRHHIEPQRYISLSCKINDQMGTTMGAKRLEGGSKINMDKNVCRLMVRLFDSIWVRCLIQ